jgi:hypothetical protein
MVINERRRARSHHAPHALQLLLQHARRRLGVRTLTLGTPAGALVAGAGDDLERIADLGARADAGHAPREVVATWRFRAGGRDLLLTSLGRAMDPDLGAGVRRILAA